MQYVNLYDDIKSIIKNYIPIDENYKKFWDVLKKDEDIIYKIFNKEEFHKLGLKFDGEAISNYDKEELEKFFNYQSYNDFFKPKDMIRFGIFMEIGFYRTVILSLKAMWESKFVKVQDFTSYSEENLDEFLEELKQGIDKNKFKPDVDEIFKCLELYSKRASKEGYDSVNKFKKLVQEMLLSDLYLFANNSNEIDFFIKRIIKEKEMHESAPEEIKEKFWIAKCKWLEMQEDLSDKLLEIENKRLENANINHQWMGIFGENFIEMQEQLARKNSLERRINLKEINPELTEEEIEEILKEKEQNEKNEIQNLKIMLLNPFKGSSCSGVADEQELLKMHEKCKKILLKIWKLIHPDRLQHNPSYKNLTEKQKAYIDNLRKKISEVKPSEIGYHESQVGWNHRSPMYLQQELDTVQKILENAGIDTNVNTIIEGNTLEEKLNWLNKDMLQLESGLETAKRELISLYEDSVVRERRRHLACPEQHENIKEKLKEISKKYKDEADELSKIKDNLFKDESLNKKENNPNADLSQKGKE